MSLSLVTTLLLFGDSKAAAAGLKHRAPIRLPRKDPKDTFTESQGDVPPVCAKDILGCDGKESPDSHLCINWPRTSLQKCQTSGSLPTSPHGGKV